MAAYAALVSLMQLIEQIQHHPNPPISLDQQQAHSINEKFSFLQRFLEDFHSRGLSQEIQALESRMADAAHAAEDIIGSQILHESGSTSGITVTENETSTNFHEGLQRVIQDLEFIVKVKDTKKKKSRIEDDQLPPRAALHLGSSHIEKTTTMVGFDDMLIQIMDRLTRNQPRRDIVLLVGMGGSGKTTFARNIYEKTLIVQHFDIRAWATISRECVVREVLIDILLCQRDQRSTEELSRVSEENLGRQVYRSLCGRRYLIVLDDVWSIEAWDKLKFFFPDHNNGSRIMITTRLTNLGFGSHLVKMDPLGEDTGWDLLCKKVFAEKSCPLELEKIGRKIARNCRGLPLSIVTIAGLLAKSAKTRDYWEYVAENLSSLVNSEDDERCLRILSLSYIHLPVHLKPCFLYMGLFLEDQRIGASHLIRLWVAEGFLKPISGKALEVVGQDYLMDLVERNLVSVHKWGLTGKIKFCVVHDLLRDMCLRKAQNERFLFVVRNDDLQGSWISNTHRRIAIHVHHSTLNEKDPFHYGTSSYSTWSLRSCIIGSKKGLKSISLRSVRILRILAGVRSYTDYNVGDIIPLVNSRFLHILPKSIPKDISFLWSLSWNLQTIIVHKYGLSSFDDFDIWNMPQLRHVKTDFIYLSYPPPSSVDEGGRLLVLENLQTLSRIRNFKCSEEVGGQENSQHQ